MSSKDTKLIVKQTKNVSSSEKDKESDGGSGTSSEVPQISTMSSMRQFTGRVSIMPMKSKLKAAPEKTMSVMSEEEEVPLKLLLTIHIWDQTLPYFPFSNDVKSTHPTILQLLYLLSVHEKWEGVTRQREYILDIVRDMFGFSLKLGYKYLLQLIEYICDCNYDPRSNRSSQSVFCVVENAHSKIIDNWNSSVLKTLKPKGKTLLSYHREIDNFLKWLALEVSFEKGDFQYESQYRISSIIDELMETMNDILDTYGNAAAIRRFLFHISKQDRCFALGLSIKTTYRMAHVLVVMGREFKMLWNSVDKDAIFDCIQPSFASMIDDLVDTVMLHSITEEDGKERIRSTMKTMYEAIENGLDSGSITELLSYFLEKRVRRAKKSSRTLMSAWQRYLKAAAGYWILLTEKWRFLTNGKAELSLTVNEQVLMFLRKYFLFFAYTDFVDKEHVALRCSILEILEGCTVGNLVDHVKFSENIRLLLNKDWSHHTDTSTIFEGLEIEKLDSLDSFIPSFSAERLG